VLGGISSLFVAGIRDEANMNDRFQSQQAVALGVDKMRREIHSACELHGSPSSPTGAVSSVTLDEPPTCGTFITWCVRSISTSRYGLYRIVGTTCTGGTQYADYITSATPFSYFPQNYTPPATPTMSYSLARLHLDITVDNNLTDANGDYRRVDDIAFRNSVRQ